MSTPAWAVKGSSSCSATATKRHHHGEGLTLCAAIGLGRFCLLPKASAGIAKRVKCSEQHAKALLFFWSLGPQPSVAHFAGCVRARQMQKAARTLTATAVRLFPSLTGVDTELSSKLIWPEPVLPDGELWKPISEIVRNWHVESAPECNGTTPLTFLVWWQPTIKSIAGSWRQDKNEALIGQLHISRAQLRFKLH